MDMIIGANRIGNESRDSIDVRNPYSGDLIDRVPVAKKEDIEIALDSAVEGQKVWENIPLYKRAEVLMKFVELFQENKDNLANLLSNEMGKTVNEAKGELDNGINTFIGFIEKAKHTYDDSFPPGMEAGTEDRLQIVMRDPVGVVVCIVPFNFPINLFSHKAAPALITGNSIIVKPPSEVPLTVIALCELFKKAGFPAGVVNVITGRGSEVGEWLIDNEIIGAVSFTGSTEVGSKIAALAGKNIIPVTLELGGNDPLIILEDADMSRAISEAVVCRVTNSGQICNASKRFLIQNSIKDKFVEELEKALSNCVVGNPQHSDTQMGCLVSEKAAIEVERQVNLTIDQGATLVFGGKREGAMYFPTILDGVTVKMDIARDLEVFGPVYPIIGFNTPDEAIEIANASKYGLSSGIITKNTGLALKIARKLKTGNVVINGGGRLRSREMPYGGQKKSGLGNEGISITLSEYTRPKNVMLKDIFD